MCIQYPLRHRWLHNIGPLEGTYHLFYKLWNKPLKAKSYNCMMTTRASSSPPKGCRLARFYNKFIFIKTTVCVYFCFQHSFSTYEIIQDSLLQNLSRKRKNVNSDIIFVWYFKICVDYQIRDKILRQLKIRFRNCRKTRAQGLPLRLRLERWMILNT